MGCRVRTGTGKPDVAFIVDQLIAAFVRVESTDSRERHLAQRADRELGSLGDRGQRDYEWNWSSSINGRSRGPLNRVVMTGSIGADLEFTNNFSIHGAISVDLNHNL